MILAGDIGGTNVRLALFDLDGEKLVLKRSSRFPARDYPSLEAVLTAFIQPGDAVRRAGFGIAGPVLRGRCVATNMPWIVDITEIKERFGFEKAVLLNDLQANGMGLGELSENDFAVLNSGEEDPEANGAMISPGTGLGESFLVRQEGRFIPQPSEGGHGSFAPRDEEEIELLRFLMKSFSHVSYERIACGSGLPNLYRFYRERSGVPEPAWLTREIEAFGDVAPAITGAALKGTDEVCVKTLDRLVKILANEASNLALKALARGGVFLGGGIPPKILVKLQEPQFLDAFCDKGRFEPLLRKMPLKVVLNDDCALLGAARAAV